MLRHLIFKCKIEKASFSEEFNSTVIFRNVTNTKICSFFFGCWIEEIDILVWRITQIKKIIRIKRVKTQVLEILECLRCHIQSLSLLMQKTIKKNTIYWSPCTEFTQINLVIFNDSYFALLSWFLNLVP